MREHVLLDNAWVHVHDDELEFPDGRRGRHLRVSPAVDGRGVVLAVRSAGRWALVLTYRHPVGSWEWGVPRGWAHSADSRADAMAELREELGTEAARLELLGTMTPDSGLLTSRCDVWLADVDGGLAGAPLDTDEVHGVRWLTRDELEAAVAAGEVADGFSLAVVALLTTGRRW